ncbi:MAG: N-acetylneuraminate epimerase [Alphaproteobacteria bacterium MarineAlpha5_Bin10]|nr:MAG: N-acetylneuraminate epimerase [Alphaproteobacteria bacterium MarineAlpha5_Bin10]|tara:strand:- start:31811 stop:32776 length:966 start_codon:yes stop_codon:yes gene_type:complete
MIHRILIALIIFIFSSPLISMQSNDDKSRCSWVEKSPMLSARSELSTLVHKEKIYVLGGIGKDKALSAFEVYDTINDKWEVLAPLPIPNHHGSLGIVNDKIYLIGGFVDLTWRHANGIIYEYDIKNNIWSEYDSLNRLRVAHTSESINDKIYIFGGHGYKPSHILYYLPKEKKMKELETRMPSPADHIASIIDLDGNFIIFGGRFREGNLNTIRIYNLQTNKWLTNNGLPYAASGHIVEILENKIHIIGGEDLQKNITFKNHWYFDLKKNIWIESIELPYGLHGMGSGIGNNTLYIFGGAKSAGMNSFHTLQNKNFKLECK